MFQEEQLYESKVFLKSYKDAIQTLKEAAQFRALQEQQEQIAKRLIEAKSVQEIDIKDGKIVPGLNFKKGREVKLFQFSNMVFQKYLNGFEQFQGEFKNFQSILTGGIAGLNSAK